MLIDKLEEKHINKFQDKNKKVININKPKEKNSHNHLKQQKSKKPFKNIYNDITPKKHQKKELDDIHKKLYNKEISKVELVSIKKYVGKPPYKKNPSKIKQDNDSKFIHTKHVHDLLNKK